jgi:4-diphosphocytidyl-2-C-methyl-D-erythritol kinase
MNTLLIDAPAKLNLSLRVLGKRDDGFHEIDTLMVKLPGLADRLEFQPDSEFSFTCDDPSLPADEDNLVVRAVRAYDQAAGITSRLAIRLTKKIPHGAGLGGGSSDAAATLSALDQLNASKLGSARLLELAAALGSDIPFFLHPGAARCTGRGEILSQVKPAPAPVPLVIFKPAFLVPTVDAYRRWSGSCELPGVTYAIQDPQGLGLVNDLERPVFEKHRFLAELKEWLLARREVRGALLCGSGSAVFAVLTEDADAAHLTKAAHHELDPELWTWSGHSG